MKHKASAARLLPLAVPVAAARIARGYLDDARRARRRLESAADPEALHDFRVALRRLRSTLRTYRSWIDGRLVSGKLRRRLKRVARATGTARDAEVGLAWLRGARRCLTARERSGGDRLYAELKARGDAAYAEVRREVVADFDRIDKRLVSALRARASAATAPALGRAIGDLVRRQVDAVAAELIRIRHASDADAIHAARVEAKRLRYLLEPLARELTHGRTLVRSLKKFQDEIGAQCDRQTLAAELVAAAGRYGAKRAARPVAEIMHLHRGEVAARVDGFEPGLRALARRLHAERERHFRLIERRYLGRNAERFVRPYRELAAALGDSAMSLRRTGSLTDGPLQRRKGRKENG